MHVIALNKQGMYITRYEEELQNTEACLYTNYNHITI
jgi:hypothetical protein